MIDIKQIKQVYLIGIGGIGMSGLARYFNEQGYVVSGYDKTETRLTKKLVSEGIAVIYEDDVTLISEEVIQENLSTLIIYTPAVPSELKILNFLKNKGHVLHKRAEVLGLLSKSKYTIAVAGTHGKTTTSSMIAHILTDSGYSCSAFLGGIASNYNTNMLISDSDLLVVEADEYDRSFLTLHPDIAIVTSTDADHLDIYENKEEFLESFKSFVNQTTEKGVRIIRKGLELKTDISYAQGEKADAYASDVKIIHGDYIFNYTDKDQELTEIKLGIPGKHNVENAVAAIKATLLVGVSAERIKAALSNFKGVKRRFEYIVKEKNNIYIDDYAHHPVELNALFTAVRSLYPSKKLTAIFQPHLFTRTRDFSADFAEALSLVDELILMPIYPAREEPIAGITSDWLIQQVNIKDKKVLGHQEVESYVRNEKPELLVTLGAGNIDQLVDSLKQILLHG